MHASFSWVREDREWERVKAYIENNPVKAGLVARAQDYPWSSAFQGTATVERTDRESRLEAGSQAGLLAPPREPEM